MQIMFVGSKKTKLPNMIAIITVTCAFGRRTLILIYMC